MWLNEFQNAIVLQDTKKLKSLMDSIPNFKDTKDIDSFLCLLKEASKVVLDLQEETKASMQKMDRIRNYLKSTQEEKVSSFTISS